MAGILPRNSRRRSDRRFTYLIDGLFVFDLKMFKRTTISPAILAATQTAGAASSGKDKIEARLHKMLVAAGCEDATLDKLGTAGLKSISIFTSIVDTKE